MKKPWEVDSRVPVGANYIAFTKSGGKVELMDLFVSNDPEGEEPEYYDPKYPTSVTVYGDFGSVDLDSCLAEGGWKFFQEVTL